MTTLICLVLFATALLPLWLIKIDRSLRIPVMISSICTLCFIPMVLFADDVSQEQSPDCQQVSLNDPDFESKMKALSENGCPKSKMQQKVVEKFEVKPRKAYLLDDDGKIIEGLEIDPDNPDLEMAMKAMKIIEDRRRAEEVAKQDFLKKAELFRDSKGGKKMVITGGKKGPEFITIFTDSVGNIHEVLWVRVKDMDGEFRYKIVREKIYPIDATKKSEKD